MNGPEVMLPLKNDCGAPTATNPASGHRLTLRARKKANSKGVQMVIAQPKPQLETEAAAV